MRRLRAALALLALAPAGCQGVHTTDVESARGAADTLLATCAAGRVSASLEVLNEPARQAFVDAGRPPDGCLEVLGLRSGGVPRAEAAAALAGARVGSVYANDQFGSAELIAPGGRRGRLELEKSRGEWLVAHAARPGAP